MSEKTLTALEREMLAVLRDLVSTDVPVTLNENAECVYCGRDCYGYEDAPCDDDCPGQIARVLIAKVSDYNDEGESQ
jgi:hypothetical protein